MRITYFYNSGFLLETEAADLLFDYWQGNFVPPAPGRKLCIFASHAHPDHYDPVIWNFDGHDTTYILGKGIRRFTPAENIHVLKKGETFADDIISVHACGSTDAGVSFLVDIGGQKIFHAGDLNNWHWNETASKQEINNMEANFARELEYVKAQCGGHVDVAFFPVDPRLGKDYMKGAKQFVAAIQTGIFVPMHFREAYVAANAFEPFAKEKGAGFFRITAS